MKRPENALTFEDFKRLPDGSFVQFIQEYGGWAWNQGAIVEVRQVLGKTYLHTTIYNESDESNYIMMNNRMFFELNKTNQCFEVWDRGWGFCFIPYDDQPFNIEDYV